MMGAAWSSRSSRCSRCTAGLAYRHKTSWGALAAARALAVGRALVAAMALAAGQMSGRNRSFHPMMTSRSRCNCFFLPFRTNCRDLICLKNFSTSWSGLNCFGPLPSFLGRRLLYPISYLLKRVFYYHNHIIKSIFCHLKSPGRSSRAWAVFPSSAPGIQAAFKRYWEQRNGKGAPGKIRKISIPLTFL